MNVIEVSTAAGMYVILLLCTTILRPHIAWTLLWVAGPAGGLYGGVTLHHVPAARFASWKAANVPNYTTTVTSDPNSCRSRLVAAIVSLPTQTKRILLRKRSCSAASLARSRACQDSVEQRNVVKSPACLRPSNRKRLQRILDGYLT